jgi:cyclase
MIENGRDPTGLNVIDWIKTVTELGAGEILLTSVDREGTRRGFDLDLISKITSLVKIPLLVSGGMGSLQHFAEVIKIDGVDGVVVADMLHYSRESISDIKKVAISEGCDIRYE